MIRRRLGPNIYKSCKKDQKRVIVRFFSGMTRGGNKTKTITSSTLKDLRDCYKLHRESNIVSRMGLLILHHVTGDATRLPLRFLVILVTLSSGPTFWVKQSLHFRFFRFFTTGYP